MKIIFGVFYYFLAHHNEIIVYSFSIRFPTVYMNYLYPLEIDCLIQKLSTLIKQQINVAIKPSNFTLLWNEVFITQLS